MEYLVTGGAGFIGSNIVRRLVGEGKSVRILDDLATGRRSNIEDLLDSVDFIEGSILDQDTVSAAVAGVSNVLHLAALPSVPRSVSDPVLTDRVNVLGTVHMLTAAKDAGVDRFVFSSSSSVYGDTEVLPKKEDMFPRPLSPYAVQKLTGEYYCKVFYNLYGLKTFALRYFNVFGPRQNPNSQYAAVIPLFIKWIRNGEPPVIHGDGEQTRDFSYVEDVINANLSCCVAPENAAGKVYNIARGDRTSVNELARMIASILEVEVEPVHDEARVGDVKDSQADPGLAGEFLNWSSKFTLEDGLKRTVDSY